MQTHMETGGPVAQGAVPQKTGPLWLIASIAGLGGLLFGYDWVVIGGARPFLEQYFDLHSAGMIGWVNSCALVGCFAGSLAAGRISDVFGRKPVLLIAAVLFAVSSVLTGWSYSTGAFILWRILGGMAIGIASSVSPMYIAEISPASLRGRLVSVNQLSLVIGILAAQITNWQIARPVPANATAIMLLGSWNVQYGWRWMFTAVAIPALLFLILAPLLPESPRWLVGRGARGRAKAVLVRIGGERYASQELASMQSFENAKIDGGVERKSRFWPAMRLPNVRRRMLLGIGLVFLQQGSGINILFNYAEEVYRSAGYGVSDVLFNIVTTGVINLGFTIIAMAIVDRFGRRQIMVAGCAGVGISHLAASFAYHAHMGGLPVLLLSLAAIACYAMSLAPVTWVLLSEIFPTMIRAQAMSLSVAVLWIASFLLTLTFPLLNNALGVAGAFLVYGTICFAGGIMVLLGVPDTRGKSLEDISHVAEPV